jgi:hypothetical protein
MGKIDHYVAFILMIARCFGTSIISLRYLILKDCLSNE